MEDEQIEELQLSLDELQVTLTQLMAERRLLSQRIKRIREDRMNITNEIKELKAKKNPKNVPSSICIAPPMSNDYFAYIQRVSDRIKELQFDVFATHTADEFTAYNINFDNITRTATNGKKEQIFDLNLVFDLGTVYDFAFQYANDEIVPIPGLDFSEADRFSLYYIVEVSTRINDALDDRIVLSILTPETVQNLIGKIKTYHANVEE